jgi:hypothetical protein
MPYSQNQRYGFCEIKLNTSWVQEAIEEMGYEYKEKGRLSEEMTEFLHMYVKLLEVAFNKFINFHKKVDFDEWFLENYYSSENYAMFDKVFMGNEDSEESDESEDEEESEECECDDCEPHFVGSERRCKSCEKLTCIQFDEDEEEGSKCGECGVSTQGRKIRSLWNNTLCEKCGEESEDEEEFDNDKLKTYNN